MKLRKIIELANQNEISRFYTKLNQIISETDNSVRLDSKADAEGFANSFNNQAVKDKYEESLRKSLRDDYYLDIAVDILIRDGNCIMTRDNFKNLYDIALHEADIKRTDILTSLKQGDRDVLPERLRDYRIYAACVEESLLNDIKERNAQSKISTDEITILSRLALELELSNAEARSLFLAQIGEEFNVLVDIDVIIKRICTEGLGFFIKKPDARVYIPEEIVEMFMKIRGQKIEKKYTRRILAGMEDKMLNKVKKKHGVKATEKKDKVEEILDLGIDIERVLKYEIYEENLTETEKKKVLDDFISNKLNVQLVKSGRTLDEKIQNLLEYYKNDEQDISSSISVDGYNNLIRDLADVEFTDRIIEEFELDRRLILEATMLQDYAIKPKDILYLYSDDEIKSFCTKLEIPTRGKNTNALISTILEHYTESENIYIDHYEDIACNNVIALSEAGIRINAEDVGVKFESITKLLFERIGIEVATFTGESKKERTDIILDFGDDGIIIVECKASKNEYSKFTSVTRQITSYVKSYQRTYKVLGAIIVAASFTPDFINECDMFTDTTLSLLDAKSLLQIYQGLKNERNYEVHPSLFFKRSVVNPEIVIKGAKRGVLK